MGGRLPPGPWVSRGRAAPEADGARWLDETLFVPPSGIEVDANNPG